VEEDCVEYGCVVCDFQHNATNFGSVRKLDEGGKVSSCSAQSRDLAGWRRRTINPMIAQCSSALAILI
jgi:hypothetical protein